MKLIIKHITSISATKPILNITFNCYTFLCNYSSIYRHVWTAQLQNMENKRISCSFVSDGLCWQGAR